MCQHHILCRQIAFFSRCCSSFKSDKRSDSHKSVYPASIRRRGGSLYCFKGEHSCSLELGKLLISSVHETLCLMDSTRHISNRTYVCRSLLVPTSSVFAIAFANLLVVSIMIELPPDHVSLPRACSGVAILLQVLARSRGGDYLTIIASL